MTDEEIIVKLTEFENRLGVIEATVEKMDKMQEQINNLVLSVNNLTNGVKNLTETTVEIKNDIKKDKEEKIKDGKDIKKQIIYTVIAIIVGAIFGKFI